MGHTYTYRCGRCSYETQFIDGYGYLVRPQSLDAYFKSKKFPFHYKTQQVLIQLAKTEEGLMVDAGFKIFKCPRCRLLYGKVEVKVLRNGAVLHKSEFRCLQCRTRLKLTNIHRLKGAVCPSCRSESFHIDKRQMILWH